MMSRHPWSREDWLLPLGIIAAGTGHFYVSMVVLGVFAVLSKRTSLRYRRQCRSEARRNRQQQAD